MTSPKEGTVVENYQGRYAKVIEVTDSGMCWLSAWVPKKTDAEKETKRVHRLNQYGLAQVLKGGADTPKEEKVEKTEAPKEEKKAK